VLIFGYNSQGSKTCPFVILRRNNNSVCNTSTLFVIIFIIKHKGLFLYYFCFIGDMHSNFVTGLSLITSSSHWNQCRQVALNQNQHFELVALYNSLATRLALGLNPLLLLL
jgi:hypothetical protein